MKLVVGLGNPGRAYRWTRHNLGFLLIERIARQNGIELSRRGFQSVYGRGKIGNEEVILSKPQTYMNLSGEAVRRLLQFFRIPPENLVVLHDDLDLPLGKIRIRLGGGHGGHQGVKSIIDALGNDGFIRLKVGIGRPVERGQDPADYVLESLTGKAKEEFKAIVERCAQVVEVLLIEGPQEAMEQFHKK
ncbi:MAG: aminoacyl-tRNA hydrolase [Deltaproteobacteria bacterium]|nr:aminoacyl-tRNA hydrolase [Deltaproteobacteria bacterium]